ncbi:MAG: hypothetical protein GTN49_09910 [candidate division Zixibacteria bacterium]|nr:hypothetical protein [candidate division Zixibacteria bacterium]
MSKLAITTAAALTLAAAAAGATQYYVNENFDGNWPPAGWRRVTGGWMQESEGPWGNYALGYRTTTGQERAYATLESCPFTVRANSTVYWHFCHAERTLGVPGSAGAEFYLRYDGSSEDIFRTPLTWGEWKHAFGSAKVAEARPLRAGFSGWVTAYPGHSAYVIISLDNVQFADESLVGVSPASLGRVKALFR